MSVYEDVLSCAKEEANEEIQRFETFVKRIESYKDWIETLEREFEDIEFIPIKPSEYTTGWLSCPLCVKCLGRSLGIKLALRIRTDDKNRTFGYVLENRIITYPSKQNANVTVMRMREKNLVALKKSLDKMFDRKNEDSLYEHFDLTDLIRVLKIAERSIKEESLAMIETYLDEIRTEKALREITEN